MTAVALLRHIFLFFILSIFTGWSWSTEATTAGLYRYDASIEYNFAGKSTDSPTHYERNYSYEGIQHSRYCCGQQLTEYQDGEVRVGEQEKDSRTNLKIRPEKRVVIPMYLAERESRGSMDQHGLRWTM